VLVGLPVDDTAATRVEVGERQEEAAVREGARGIFEAQALAVRVPGYEGLRPPMPLGQRPLREHDQGRDLSRMKGTRRHDTQGFAVVAEQPCGGRIGIDDPVCIRVENEHRLGELLEHRAEIVVTRLNHHITRPYHEMS